MKRYIHIIIITLCLLVSSCKQYKSVRYKPQLSPDATPILGLIPLAPQGNLTKMYDRYEKKFIDDIIKLNADAINKVCTSEGEKHGFFTYKVTSVGLRTKMAILVLAHILGNMIPTIAGAPVWYTVADLKINYYIFDAQKNLVATYEVESDRKNTRAFVAFYWGYSNENSAKVATMKAHQNAFEKFQKLLTKDADKINQKLKLGGVVKREKSDVIGNSEYSDYDIFLNSFADQNTDNAGGTGFLVSSTTGIVVTNFHVVDGAKQIRVSFNSGTATKSYWANVINEDKVNNIAVLKIDDEFVSPGQLPYTITDDYNIKEPVFTCAFTQIGDSVTGYNSNTGEISELFGYENNQTLLKITATVTSGNSGGPLFNSKGQVIGICTGTDNSFFYNKYQDKIPKGVNYAVKSDYILPLIKQYKDKNAPVQNNLPQSEQLKEIQKFICKISIN